MTTIKVHGGIDILRLPVNEEEHVFPPWYIKYTQSHILHSKCSKSEEGCREQDPGSCQFCMYVYTFIYIYFKTVTELYSVIYLAFNK